MPQIYYRKLNYFKNKLKKILNNKSILLNKHNELKFIIILLDFINQYLNI